MLSRPEYLYLKVRIEKIEKEIAHIKQLPDALVYAKYLAMTPLDQSLLRKKWVDYYEDVQSTESYAIWKDEKTAFENKPRDMDRIGKLKKMATGIRENNLYQLPLPSSQDPDLLEVKVLNMLKPLKTELWQLKEKHEEYSSVYGKRDFSI